MTFKTEWKSIPTNKIYRYQQSQQIFTYPPRQNKKKYNETFHKNQIFVITMRLWKKANVCKLTSN